MGSLLNITPTEEDHPTRTVTVGEDVRPTWTLPVDADPADVEFDFIGGATVTGDDLEKRGVGGGEFEYRPKVGPNAPACVSTFQLVELRWDGPGERGASDRAVIHADPVPGPT